MPSKALTHTPKYKRLTDEQRMVALQLRKLGKTQTEIAHTLGCDQSVISRWLSQCQDSTAEAITFLRGQALPMARNIVENGLARDHLVALKGVNVLAEDRSQAIQVLVGNGGTVNFGGLSPLLPEVSSESVENS